MLKSGDQSDSLNRRTSRKFILLNRQNHPKSKAELTQYPAIAAHTAP